MSIGRRIRFLEPPERTAFWIRNERRMNNGKASFHPTYGMTGVVVALPPKDHIGASVKVRWDNGQTTWLGSMARFEFLT